eukprot:4702148-Ditylum_brightwellii.AAC.1
MYPNSQSFVDFIHLCNKLAHRHLERLNQSSGFDLLEQNDWLQFLRAVTLMLIPLMGLEKFTILDDLQSPVASHMSCGVISMCTAIDVACQCKISG